jgi:Protein of unknown function (DUF1501)
VKDPTITRRRGLQAALLGAGAVGLRALATGLPPAFLLNPRRALADGAACGSNSKAQYIILNTSANGDPLNASAPGTYEDANIVHSSDPSMAAKTLTIRGQSHTAAAPWATLPQNVLDRTCFWHLMTSTSVHPKEPDVLKLMGTTNGSEMLPSLLAKQLAPCLGTIQAQPISLGASTPSEGLSYAGSPLPIIPALALKATLTSPAGPLTDLQALRDQTMNQLYDVYKAGATPAQRAFVDSMVTSQQQVRNINQKLLDALTSIKDNSVASQILAAVTMIQMKVTPVIAIHVPFGGDNHNDTGLAGETSQTVAGVASIASLMQQLATAGLSDQVTLMSLNVFGRTLGPGNTNGRQHNPNHQVSITIGKPFKGGVIGGVAPLAGDYGATAIRSTTGASDPGGDVAAGDSLAAYGRTMLAAVGVPSASISSVMTAGSIITGALA